MAKKEQQNSAITYLEDIQSSFKAKNTALIVMGTVCVLVCAIIGVMSYMAIVDARKNVFFIDRGAALMAARADNKEQFDLEIKDQVRKFHEYFYNLAPNNEMINQNITRALNLFGDNSADEFFRNQKETKYYSKLIDLGAIQQIKVDSIRLDLTRYPYHVDVISTLAFLRQSTIAYYRLRTSCDATEEERTPNNPHGIILWNFYAAKTEQIMLKAK